MRYHVIGATFDAEVETSDGRVVRVDGPALAWTIHSEIKAVIDYARRKGLKVVARERFGSRRSFVVLDWPEGEDGPV